MYNRSGQYTIPVLVNDGLLTNFVNYTFTVRNSTPEVRQLQFRTGTTTTDIINGSKIELARSTTYTRSTNLFDADGDVLTTTWTVGSEVALTSNVVTSQISITTPASGLDIPVTLTISDNDAAPVVLTFLLTTRPQVIPEPSTAMVALTATLPLLARQRTSGRRDV